MPTKRLASHPSRKRSGISSPVPSPSSKKHQPSSPTPKRSGIASPVPSPSSKNHQPSSPTPAPAPTESDAMTARKSPRKRAAAPSKLMDAGAASRSAAPKKWTADDEIALLRGALAHREETGFLPKAQTMNSFFDSIKETISADLGPSQVYNKMRRLKALYFKRSNPGPTAYDRLVYELSSEVWGVNEKKDVKNVEDVEDVKDVEDAEDVKDVKDVEDVEDVENDDDDEDAKDADEEENGSGAYPYLTATMAAHWKDHPHLAVEFLKEGLKKIDPDKALELEERVMEHCRGVAEVQLKKFQLYKEVLRMLLGP